MEIDLEFPSGKQERLDADPITSNYVMNGADRVNVEEDTAVREEQVTKGCQHDAEKFVSCGGQGEANNALANFNQSRAVCEPKDGLEFEMKEAAYAFYREYARSIGFGITIKASRWSKRTGNFNDVKIMCSRFGNKHGCDAVVNPRSCTKTECKAGIHMKRTDDGYVILLRIIIMTYALMTFTIPLRDGRSNQLL